MQTQLIVMCTRVRHEMHVFRQEYLPVFLALTPEEIWGEIGANPEVVKVPSPSHWRRPPPLSAWQRAVKDLATTLPAESSRPSSNPHFSGVYKEFIEEPHPGFLPEEPEPCLRMANDALVWQIKPKCLLDLSGYILQEPWTAVPNLDDTGSWLPQFKDWLMQIPPHSNQFYHSLCSGLPYIAYFDPAFAKLALDRTTWETIVERDPNMPAERRLHLLERFDGRMFRNVLNNALLHVFAALAGNHFFTIGELLDHPCIQGGYTHLMPYYLFAILLGKTRVLLRLLDQTKN